MRGRERSALVWLTGAAASIALLLLSCGGGVSWRPYKAEYLHPRPIAARAALIYEGDVETVVAAGAKLIGQLKTKSDRHAQIHGARHGGTHVYLVRSESQTFAVGTNCSSSTQTYLGGATTNSSCRNLTRTVVRNHYAVLQLAPGAWASLPPLLRPVPFGKPSCAPLPKVPKGCSYTHYRGFMQMDPDRVYLDCDNGEPVDVTDRLPPNACPLESRW